MNGSPVNGCGARIGGSAMSTFDVRIPALRMSRAGDGEHIKPGNG
jgi:hypothetical protein